jgi:hypothetical protein
MNYTKDELMKQVRDLKAQHREAELEIEEIIARKGDDLKIQRLKKKKLYLKDKIAMLRQDLDDDIIA